MIKVSGVVLPWLFGVIGPRGDNSPTEYLLDSLSKPSSSRLSRSLAPFLRAEKKVES